MKKILLAIISIAAIFASCSEKVETVQEEITPSQNEKVVLRASVPEADTKVSSDNAGAFAWQVGDKVTVLNTDGTPYEFETEEGGTAVDFSSTTFTGKLSEEAFYPASAQHASGKFYLEPSFSWAPDASCMPMIGTVNTTDLTSSFASVGAVLKLVCFNVDKTANKLVVTSDSKQIVGQFTPANDKITAEASTENKVLTISFDTATEDRNMVFYVPLPTGNVGTLTFDIKAGDTNKFSKTTKTAVNLERNKVVVPAALNCASASTIVSEDFSGYVDGAVPSGTVGGVSYSCTNGNTNTTVKKGNSENYAGGTTPEILIGKAGGVFKISGINCSGISTMTLTFKKNNNSLTVTATEGITVTGSTSGTGTKTITLTNVGTGSPKVPLTSFDLSFTAGSNNVRVDDILLTSPIAFTAPSITTGVETLTVGVGQTSKSTDCSLSNAIDGLGISTILTGNNTSWIESVAIANGKLTLTAAGTNVSGEDYTATLTLKATGATNKVVTLKQINSLVPNPSVTVTPGNAKFTATWTGDTHATSYVAYLRTTDSDPLDVNGDPTTGTTDITSSISESEGVYSIADYPATNNQAYYLYVKVNGVSSNYSAPTGFVKKNFTPTTAPVPIDITTSSTTSTGDNGKITVACAKGNGQNDPYETDSNKVRLYASNRITITSTDKNIAKIELSFNKNGSKTYASISAGSGSYSSGGTSTSGTDIKVDTWTGDSKSIVLTLGDSGQRELSKVSVTYKN